MSEKSLDDRLQGSVFLLSLGLFGLFWATLAMLKADPTVLPGLSRSRVSSGLKRLPDACRKN